MKINPSSMQENQPQCHIVELDETARLLLYPTRELALKESDRRTQSLLESNDVIVHTLSPRL